MGGHGTWYLGATFPGKYAAIAPCAGYPTLTGYGSADGKIPESGRSGVENMLLRASNPSNVLQLDEQAPLRHVVQEANEVVFLAKGNEWQFGKKPAPTQKGTNRNGTFKEPFNHRTVFVYGTCGTPEENTWSYNKARYDAEVWYYRGNGALYMVADKDFNPAAFADRGVVIYGNYGANTAYKKLLAKWPITVQRGSIRLGGKLYPGDDLGAYFTWPRADSDVASVAVVSGTGLKGMQAADENQYFAGGSGFPDYMVFSLDMVKDGQKGMKAAGFFGNDWTLEKGESVVQ